MRKLELKKEHLGNLSSQELGNVVGAAAVASLGGAAQCVAIVARTVKDTECGGQCVGTYPINQCWISLWC